MFERIGFKKDETDVWYGIVNGIYYILQKTVVDSQPVYSLTSEYECSSLLGSVIDFVENAKREDENLIYKYSITQEKLYVNFYAQKKDIDYKAGDSDSTSEFNASKIEDFIESFSGKLKALDVKNTCVHCGNQNYLYFYKYNKGISVMCENCGENLRNQITVEQNVKNNYFKGFIGSLIGAVIGSVVWVLLSYAGWVASIAGYAIAFCAFYGYKMLKGKLNKTGVIINIITIIIAFLLANYTGLYIELKKEFELSVAQYIMVTPAFFSDKEMLLAMGKDLLIGAIFLALGIWSTVKKYFVEAGRKTGMKLEKLTVWGQNTGSFLTDGNAGSEKTAEYKDFDKPEDKNGEL